MLTIAEIASVDWNRLIDFVAGEWSSLLEILVIAVVLYLILCFLRVVRGTGFLGLIVVSAFGFLAAFYVTSFFNLDTIELLLRQLLTILVLVVIIIFQPELRRGLIRLGQHRIFGVFLTGEAAVVQEVVKAVRKLAQNKIGAVIAIERDASLSAYVESGRKLDAEVSSELISTIFWPGSPLHDLGIVIRHQRLAAAGCVFPLSQRAGLSPTLGSRHRAALGLSEETDAVVIVVSEETGNIALAVGGELVLDVEREKLLDTLRGLLLAVSTRTEASRE